MNCGLVFDPQKLDFHHRDPSTKVATISSLTRASKEKRQAEIDKCDILCKLCHRQADAELQKMQRTLVQKVRRDFQKVSIGNGRE